MKKINKHIEIVRSSKKGLNSLSQESCDGVLVVLTKNYAKVGVTIVNNLQQLEALADIKPDLVFLGMKFVPANEELGLKDPNRIWLTDFFDEHDITYTGSSQTAHELELNKPLAKQCAQEAGIKTSPFLVIRQGQIPSRADFPLEFPLFVKPTSRGGGFGVDSDSVVLNFEQLQSKIQAISALQSDSLIEEYLSGREFSVALLKNEQSSEFMVMPLELIVQPDSRGARLLSGKVKSSNEEITVEVTDATIKSKICELALDMFHALGARDYGRIDIRLDKNGTVHFLEANLLPSLISGYGSFPKACVLNIGLDYEPMILSIVRLGLARSLEKTDEDILAPALEGLLEPA